MLLAVVMVLLAASLAVAHDLFLKPVRLRGGTLRVPAVVDGAPLANQFVVYGGRMATGGRIARRNLRTDAKGTAVFPLRSADTCHVKFIHMMQQAAEGEADYESKWATLTFEIR